MEAESNMIVDFLIIAGVSVVIGGGFGGLLYWIQLRLARRKRRNRRL